MTSAAIRPTVSRPWPLIPPGQSDTASLDNALELLVELPGGGQVLFPGRRLVALYGHPGTSSLGVLGEQGPEESVERAQQLASEYEPFSDEPVLPAFEIIATVASYLGVNTARGTEGVGQASQLPLRAGTGSGGCPMLPCD